MLISCGSPTKKFSRWPIDRLYAAASSTKKHIPAERLLRTHDRPSVVQ